MFERHQPDWWSGREVVILGAAKSGLAAAELLHKRGNRVTISEYGQISEAVQTHLNELGIPFEYGGHQAATLQQAEVIIASPGIPVTASPFMIAAEAGVPVISEIELAVQLSTARMIAITGSNGKTTTVSLTYELLRQAGYKVACGGNIGTPLISLVEGDYDYLVVELSSFQLETTYNLKPYIGVLLNVYPNHLDRHGDMDTYFTLKARLFQQADTHTYAVLNAENEWTRKLADTLPAQILTFAKTNEQRSNSWFDNGVLIRESAQGIEAIARRDELPLLGTHNLENYLAVSVISGILQISPEVVKRAFQAILAIPHRLEFVRRLNKRVFINDSKATNYLATIKALESLEGPIILIAGGQDKGGDLTPLADVIHQKVRQVILLGQAAESIYQRLAKTGYNQIRMVETMQDAVNLAYQLSAESDTILLSPACASYDMFSNFEQRGEVFKSHVAEVHV